MTRIAGYALIVSLSLLGHGATAWAQQDPIIYNEDVHIVDFEHIEYPILAKRSHVQGPVVLNVQLDDAGNVAGASALSGSQLLIPDALTNIKKWRFKPNVRKGVVFVYDFRIAPHACKDDSHSLFLVVHNNLASITACSRLTEWDVSRPGPQ